jgi:hypothetical protein
MTYMNYMHIIILLLIISTTGVLITGVISMGFGSKSAEDFRNKLMMARVVFQLLTIIILIITLVVFYSSK